MPKTQKENDFRNAFNEVDRTTVLYNIKKELPEYFASMSHCYQQPSHLQHGEHRLEFVWGVQQGDPLGPLAFCLAVMPLAKRLKSPLDLWYLDDATIAGEPETVLSDLREIMAAMTEFGLEVNLSKCEAFLVGGTEEERLRSMGQLHDVTPLIPAVERRRLCLLGAPLTDEAIQPVIAKKTAELYLMCERLVRLSIHRAVFLLRNCFAMPKLIYILRTTPTFRSPECLQAFDHVLRSSLQEITNNDITDEAWSQSTLPGRLAGMGIRRAAELAVPAFLASVHAALGQLSQSAPWFDSEAQLGLAESIWKDLAQSEFPTGLNQIVQKQWDLPIANRRLRGLLTAAEPNPLAKARLLASIAPESSSWLNAFPSFGNHLDDDATRIAVGLRLGTKLCCQHKCHNCGKLVDEWGYHGLACSRPVRLSRHAALNEVLHRHLYWGGIQSQLEPPGISRQDGKRPDGMTIAPYSAGKQVLWDVTCVDTMCQSNVGSSALHQGKAAEKAELDKVDKYQALTDRFTFIPFGVETMGPFGPSAKDFVRSVGRRVYLRTHEKRATDFLMQSLSIAIQRVNAACVLGALPPQKAHDEIYFVLKVNA